MNAPRLLPQPVQGTEEESFDLRMLWLAVRYRWRMVASLTLLSLGVATLLLLMLPPLYTAQVRLVIQPPQVRLGLEELLTGSNISQEEIDTEIEIIRSRKVIERVVEALNLTRDPEFNPALLPPSWREYLSPSRWLPEAWKEAIFGPPEQLSPEEKEKRLRAGVVDRVRDRLKVSRVGRSRVIQIAFTSEDPKKAAQIANAIAKAYLQEQIESRFEATSRVARWLQQRLKELKEQVIAAEKAVALYKAQHGLTETESATLVEQQLAELNSKYILAKADLAEAEAQLQQVERLLRKGGAVNAAKVLNFPLIQRLVEQEAEVVRKVAEISERYGPRHPKMIEARAELASIRQKIEREVQKVVQSLRNEVGVARARVQSLQKALARLESQKQAQSQAEVKLKELEREAEAVRTVYETFLNRFKQLSEQGQLQQTEARVIAWAEPPQSPSYPRKGLTLALVSLVSLFGGGGLAILLESLVPGFREERQLEFFTGRPVASVLPEEEDRKLPDLLLQKPTDPFCEGIRHLRTALPQSVILVTSTLPGEGKSTVALSLARSYALSGLKTLLLDFDLRHPGLLKLVGLEGEGEGVPRLLRDPSAWSQLIARDPKLPDLHLILTPPERQLHPTDLLEQADLEALFGTLRSNFDRIVLDSPPVALFSDPILLAPFADGIAYMVRYRETPREAVVGALRKLAEVSSLWLVFNRVAGQERGGYYYYHYGRYYGERD